MADVERALPPPLPPGSRAPEPARRRSQRTSVAPAPRRVSRGPLRRVLRAYFTTTQVALSYLWLGVQRRFRTNEAFEPLLQDAHRRNARRVEAAISDLQGLFIKVGQLISIMANFLPVAFREELEGLQDQVPPRPYEDIEARLREELGGRGPEEVFASFDRTPVASASIGQVHVARLHSGEQVAVKVQYPDIEEIVRVDLRVLRRIFHVLAWFLPDWGFPVIYREIREMVLAELDYRQEAEAIAMISGNFAGRTDVLFPRVKPEHSTARVITTEWMTGTKVANLGSLAAPVRKRAARLFVESYCQQIFVDGVYHADPHPGNLLVRVGDGDEVAIVFLDFGATARVSERMRKGMISFLQGAMTRDTGRIVAAMKDMGFISRRADPAVFDRVVEYFHDRFRAEIKLDGFSLKDIRFEPEQNLESLLDLHGMNVSLADLRDAFHVPKEWVLLERALLLLLGVCTTLDPEMNPAQVIMPYLERFLLGGFGKAAVGKPSGPINWSEAAVDAGREAALAALALPGELRRFLTAAGRGELELRVRNLDESARLVYDAGQQLLWGALGAASTGFAVVFDGRGQTRARLLASLVAMGCGGLFAAALFRGRRAYRRRR